MAIGEDDSLTVDLGLRRLNSALLTATNLELTISDEDGGAEGAAAVLPWRTLDKVAKKQRFGAWECYGDGDAPDKIEGMSELTSRTASLMPTEGRHTPPTAVLAGFNMHRTKQVHPGEDTERKLSALGRARGRVLDVCTGTRSTRSSTTRSPSRCFLDLALFGSSHPSGLGYTSIGAARMPTVTEVVTIELDTLMVQLQRANPWSADLFDNPKIQRLLGDATEVLPALPERYFDCIVHDPPANALSGELYSLEFYQQASRALQLLLQTVSTRCLRLLAWRYSHGFGMPMT